MTLPDERYRAVKYARDFLRSLLDPKQTPKVPRAVRQQAGRVLRHFPGEYDMERTAKKVPSVWESPRYEDNGE